MILRYNNINNKRIKRSTEESDEKTERNYDTHKNDSKKKKK